MPRTSSWVKNWGEKLDHAHHARKESMPEAAMGVMPAALRASAAAANSSQVWGGASGSRSACSNRALL
jgi:hypothetical protein